MVIRVHGAASEPAYKSQKIMWVDPSDALVPLPVKKVAESRPPLLDRIHPRGTIHRLEAASTATVPSPPTLASFHSRPFFCNGLDTSLRNYIREK